MTRPAASAVSQQSALRQRVRGQVMILFALASIVLIGAAALSVDVGMLLAERRQVQAAADAAALAAAQSAMDNNADVAAMVAAAEAYAEENAGVDATVVVDPNATGPGDGDRYVEVTVTVEVQQFFLGAVYQGDWNASATAIAAVEGVDGNYALITLDPDADPGIYMNGNTGIIITGNQGGAASNSTMHGNNNTTFQVEGVLHAFGSIQAGNNWDALDIVANRNRLVPDPLAGVDPPNPLSERNFPSNCNGSCTLLPGIYRDQDFNIKGTATLSPGAYYFENSSIDLQNTNSTIQGNGVSLYFDADSLFDPKNGNVNLRAVSNVDPEDEPTYADIVFWAASCDEIDLQGNGEMYFEGIFYAPCAHVWMHGNPANETARGQVIVGSLDVRGTSDMGIVYEQRAATSQPAVFLVR